MLMPTLYLLSKDKSNFDAKMGELCLIWLRILAVFAPLKTPMIISPGSSVDLEFGLGGMPLQKKSCRSTHILGRFI